MYEKTKKGYPEMKPDYRSEIAGINISTLIYNQAYDLPFVNVIEDDTCRALGADPGFIEPRDSLWNLRMNVTHSTPYPPGSIVPVSGKPKEIIAIVYDLNQSPICREEWIMEALKGILLWVDERQLGILIIPVLGARYGGIHFNRFLDMLTTAITYKRPMTLKWIELK
jgi:hypothetical protein